MLFLVIYPIGFGTKEPEDERLCKAVLILIDTHTQNARHNIKANQQHTQTLPYITLENSCLSDTEMKVIGICTSAKMFESLKDEIGTYSNIEVETEITDKSPFFISLYHVKVKDKAIIDKEMKRLCY